MTARESVYLAIAAVIGALAGGAFATASTAAGIVLVAFVVAVAFGGWVVLIVSDPGRARR